MSSQTVANLETLHAVGNWVLPAGQVLQFHTAGRQYRVLISGYDLVNL